MKHYMFSAINKHSGLGENIFAKKNKPAPDVKFLQSCCDQGILLCHLCKTPVIFEQQEHKIWAFVCENPKHRKSFHVYDSEPDDFRKKEEDYYSPEHFEDDDIY